MPQWAELLRQSLDPDPVSAYRTRHPSSADPREPDPPALVLARRVEALARVIASPDRAAMRLARFIAKLPREALDLLKETTAIPRPYWLQGGDDPRHGAAHVRRAAAVLCAPDTG